MSIFRESQLRADIERGELVIRVGINMLDGHETHPKIPPLKFDDREQFAFDVISEMFDEEEDGNTPISQFIDDCIEKAILNGSIGIADDSPTRWADCSLCCTPTPIRYDQDENGAICMVCQQDKTTPGEEDV